jgi:hypothetical protein
VHAPDSRMVVFFFGGGANIPPQFAGFKDFRDEEKKVENP